ncbi:protoglobin domain-containing protein [Heyndrickxia oleronia]|uniref:protoglobin domain-containing protein n=1 Tax=Heyndrickxia oleronia TaxID=38875 RepID=UPI003751C130
MSWFKKTENSKSTVKQQDRLPVSISLDLSDQELMKQMEMIHFTKKDIRAIASIKTFVDQNIDKIVDDFYKALGQQPNLFEIINQYSSIERLSQTLRRHICEMFEGKINQEFVEKRIKIAIIHLQIGLEPKWYLGAFQNLFYSLIEIVEENIDSKAEVIEIIKSISKLLNFEQQIVLEAYEKEFRRFRKKHEEERILIEQKIADVSETLSNFSDRTNEFMTQLNQQSVDMLAVANENVEIANIMENEAHSSKDKLHQEQQLINNIETSTRTINDRVKDLKKASEQVHSIISIITSIAEQTNLLALNAAIESARAGEYGRGFSVVADEVRKLAEETKKSIGNVSTLIEGINSQIEDVTSSVEEVSHLTQESSKEISNMDVFFEKILQAAEKNKHQSGVTKVELTQTSDIIHQVTKLMEQISGSSEDLMKLSQKF